MAAKEMRTEPMRNHRWVRLLERVVRGACMIPQLQGKSLAALAGCYAWKRRESMHNKFCQCRMNSKALHIEPRSRLSELANVIGDHAHGFATRLLLMVT